jgi:hypothetical protein
MREPVVEQVPLGRVHHLGDPGEAPKSRTVENPISVALKRGAPLSPEVAILKMVSVVSGSSRHDRHFTPELRAERLA